MALGRRCAQLVAQGTKPPPTQQAAAAAPKRRAPKKTKAGGRRTRPRPAAPAMSPFLRAIADSTAVRELPRALKATRQWYDETDSFDPAEFSKRDRLLQRLEAKDRLREYTWGLASKGVVTDACSRVAQWLDGASQHAALADIAKQGRRLKEAVRRGEDEAAAVAVAVAVAVVVPAAEDESDAPPSPPAGTKYRALAQVPPFRFLPRQASLRG